MMKWLLSIAAGSVFGGGSALAQTASNPDQAWTWQHGWGMGGMMFGGSLVMLIFWGATILLTVLLVRWLGQRDSAEFAPPRQSALEILQQRFARGDIDKQEYEERRRTLASG